MKGNVLPLDTGGALALWCGQAICTEHFWQLLAGKQKVQSVRDLVLTGEASSQTDGEAAVNSTPASAHDRGLC